jgi:hypothetical protein
MSTEEMSRIFMPQRKTVHRSNSSSSLASTASSSSVSSTATATDASSSANGDNTSTAVKKKTRGGFWPVSKAESTASVSATRANGSVQPLSGKAPVQPALPSQNGSQVNGPRAVNGNASQDSVAVLALLPMNGTFERKQISLPLFPDTLRVGRQTNAKTVPTPMNGFFDSKVLSRQHAEIWAERSGKVWIRDVKSSNGTFVNGQRLSQENRESDPHELRQHDTLELGIDIVSEDQKTIVHHKVSAKVEYVGLPGASNNVLDLSFGDLDPSHGSSLLPSPLSSPMMHQRSRPGGPLGPGRSAPSSVAGGQVNAAAQNRQINLWGAPLSIEHLVKSISVSSFPFGSSYLNSTNTPKHEMRAANQQTNDIDNIEKIFNSVSPAENIGSQTKDETQTKEEHQPLRVVTKARSIRNDNLSRFAEPPNPPPQQPLPEKPDSAKSTSLSSMSLSGLLKRSDTAKPGSTSGSPTGPNQSSMLQLVEALSQARKELESHSVRVKELEQMLKEERSARADAEEKARKLEQTAAARPVMAVEEVVENDVSTSISSSPTKASESADMADASQQDLQARLEHMVVEMQQMKSSMDQFQQRAETAEADATKARESLSEMIQRIRQENAANKETLLNSGSVDPKARHSQTASHNADSEVSYDSKVANGHIPSPKLPRHLEQVVATALRQTSSGNDETLVQSAPYVSMLGVVLIGVGIMAYLNSWQKTDK